MGQGGAVVSSVHTQAARRMTTAKAPIACSSKEEAANRSEMDSDARYCCPCVTARSDVDPLHSQEKRTGANRYSV